MSSNVSREFSEEGFSKMADEINRGKENVPLSSMGGQIIEVEVPLDGTEVEVPHNLKATPKYMLELRRSGAAVIYDGETPWTDKTIFLRAAAVLDSASGGTYGISFSPSTVPVYTVPSGMIWNTSNLSGSVNIAGGSSPTGTIKITIMLMRG